MAVCLDENRLVRVAIHCCAAAGGGLCGAGVAMLLIGVLAQARAPHRTRSAICNQIARTTMIPTAEARLCAQVCGFWSRQCLTSIMIRFGSVRIGTSPSLRVQASDPAVVYCFGVVPA